MEEIKFPDGKYNVIVVDPPWPVKKIVRKCRPNQTKNLDYQTMSLEEISELCISGLADNSAMLFFCGLHMRFWKHHLI